MSDREFLALEYDKLKAEQIHRIGVRDNLLYATLAAYGATGYAAVNGKPVAVLALPIAAVVLGWTYLANDAKVSAIGTYIRDDLDPRLTGLAGGQSPMFGWETAHRSDTRYRARKRQWLTVDLLTYCAIPLGALLSYWMVGPYSAALIALSVVECVAVAAVGCQVVRHTEFTLPSGAGLRALAARMLARAASWTARWQGKRSAQ